MRHDCTPIRYWHSVKLHELRDPCERSSEVLAFMCNTVMQTHRNPVSSQDNATAIKYVMICIRLKFRPSVSMVKISWTYIYIYIYYLMGFLYFCEDKCCLLVNFRVFCLGRNKKRCKMMVMVSTYVRTYYFLQAYHRSRPVLREM